MQSFEIMAGVQKRLVLKPKDGSNVGLLAPGEIVDWTHDAGLASAPSPDGLSGVISSNTPGTYVITHAYMSTPNSYPKRQEQVQITITPRPADHLEYELQDV